MVGGRKTDEQGDRQVSDDPGPQEIHVSHRKHKENKSLEKYTAMAWKHDYHYVRTTSKQ